MKKSFSYKSALISLMIFLVFVTTLSSISLVKALLPQAQVSELSGDLEIAYPKYEVVKQNTTFDLHFHVFNITDYITNNTGNCYLHLYNTTGNHILEQQATGDSNLIDFKVEVNNKNFSDNGYYAYIIYCNTTIQSGFASGSFLVTSLGLYPANDNLTIFIYMMFIILLCGLLSLFIINVAKLATASTTVYDVAYNWAFYSALIINYYLAQAYLIDSFIVNNATVYLGILGFTAGILPMISLFISIFVQSAKKKRLLTVDELTGRGFTK